MLSPSLGIRLGVYQEQNKKKLKGRSCEQTTKDFIYRP